MYPAIQRQAGFAGEYMTLDKHLLDEAREQAQSTVSSLLTLECKQYSSRALLPNRETSD